MWRHNRVWWFTWDFDITATLAWVHHIRVTSRNWANTRAPRRNWNAWIFAPLAERHVLRQLQPGTWFSFFKYYRIVRFALFVIFKRFYASFKNIEIAPIFHSYVHFSRVSRVSKRPSLQVIWHCLKGASWKRTSFAQFTPSRRKNERR